MCLVLTSLSRCVVVGILLLCCAHCYVNVVVLGFYISTVAKLIQRWDISLKSYPKA